MRGYDNTVSDLSICFCCIFTTCTSRCSKLPFLKCF